jgi:hypothetical protein
LIVSVGVSFRAAYCGGLPALRGLAGKAAGCTSSRYMSMRYIGSTHRLHCSLGKWLHACRAHKQQACGRTHLNAPGRATLARKPVLPTQQQQFRQLLT